MREITPDRQGDEHAMPDVQDVVRGRRPPAPQPTPPATGPVRTSRGRGLGRAARRTALAIGGVVVLTGVAGILPAAFSGHTDPVPVEYAASRIEIVSDSEGVDVASTSDDRATIATPTLFGDTRGEVAQSHYGDTLRLQLSCEQWGCRDFRIAVPAGVEVTTRLTSGSVDVRDVASVRVTSTSGAVAVENVAGEVNVETTSGSVDVAGVRGATRLRSSSGSIDVADTDARVSAESDSGSIDVANARGETWLRSSSGSIDVAGVDGDVTAESTSGSIDVADSRAGRLSLSSTSGSIDAEVTSGLQRLRAESSSGSVDVSVPGDATYSVLGQSSSGSRSIDVPQDTGGIPLWVQTGSGSVDIEQG